MMIELLRNCITASVAALLTSTIALADITRLDFDASPAHPGTIADITGEGTGFTARLPGSGSSIPANDPNLQLDTANSQLLIGSTRSDFANVGFGRNLEGMEAPSILLSGIGASDFIVRAKFLDIHTDQLSDQIGVFVGTSVDNLIRAMSLEENTPGSYQASFVNSQNGADGPPTGGSLGAVSAGDDGVIELGRIGGHWYFSWQNLTEPQLSNTVSNFTVPNIDSQNDLYFGLFNHDARNFTPQTAIVDYFEIRTGTSVPESSSLALAAIGMVCGTLWRLLAPRTLNKQSQRFQPALASPNQRLPQKNEYESHGDCHSGDVRIAH